MVLALSFLGNLAVVLFCAVAVSLVLIVLLQKGRGGGLSGAFGGAGGAGSLLGTKTGDVLTWITICLVALFLVMGVLLGKFMRPSSSSDLSGDLSTPAAAITSEDVAEVVDEAAAAAEGTAAEATEEAEAVVEEATEAVEEMVDDADDMAEAATEDAEQM